MILSSLCVSITYGYFSLYTPIRFNVLNRFFDFVVFVFFPMREKCDMFQAYTVKMR